MTDTVPVTVNLPKPLEGWEWGECPSGHCDGSHFNERRHTLRLHRVAPPECMAVEMLVSDVLVWAAGRTSPAIDARAFDAARKALGQAAKQPEDVCDCGTPNASPTQHRAFCRSYEVREIARKAVAQQEVCGVTICRSIGENIWWTHTCDECPAIISNIKTCRQPKDHDAGAHSPEVKT